MRIIAYSSGMKGDLDDDYTLFENGEILHEYDAHRYPGGYNLKRTLKASDLNESVKNRLVKTTSDEDKEFVKNLFGI